MKRLVDEHPEWSDRQIGRACGVSHSTVSKYRRGEVASLATSPDPGTDDGDDGQEWYPPEETAEKAARTLVRDLARLDDRRGLLARFSGKRATRDMGTALAEALADQYYDDVEHAVRQARAWSEWLTHAITALEEFE